MEDGTVVSRPYTPVSSDTLGEGHVDLLIKVSTEMVSYS
jgi:hypothetical protein